MMVTAHFSYCVLNVEATVRTCYKELEEIAYVGTNLLSCC